MKNIRDELLSSTYMNEHTYESMHVDPEFSKWMFENFDVEDFEELEEIWSVGSKLKQLVDFLED